MLNHDISTADALAHLSFPDTSSLDDLGGYNRRRFLQLVGMGVGSAAFGGIAGAVAQGLIPSEAHEAWAAGPVGPNDGIVVLMGMYGGNDGLNTVVPYTNGLYYDYRQNLAIAQNQVLAIDGNVGLHPGLPFLKSMYDSGQVAILQGLGYANPDLSHFSSMAYWMSGLTGGVPNSGWVGRWMDIAGGPSDLFQAVTIGSSVPLHMVGATRRATSIPESGIDFGGRSEPSDLLLYNAIRQFSVGSGNRGPWHDAIAVAERGQIEVAQAVSPLFAAALPESEIVKKMTIAARLINANLGLRVIDASWGDFDTHSDQPWDHTARMVEFNAGLQAFFTTLDPQFSQQVSVVTFSEFGRTPWSNDSFGTDHGTANNHFVIGANVRGGLYGQQPSLAGMRRWDRLQHTTDFRSMYASVLDQWLGGGAGQVLGANYEQFPVFNSLGGDGVGTPPSGVAYSEFVGITPARIMDSRNGLGTTKAKLGAGSTRSLQVTGKGGVPASGVLAAVVNVTAVGGSGPSFFTVYPTGTGRPNTSTLNLVNGEAVPNLALAMIGSSGRINIFNSTGSADCIVDVVGYFRPETSSKFTPVTPRRIVDSRDGTGVALARVGHGATIDVQVAGNGGVAGDADSVVMNVTVTNPSATSYITVWPTGQPMPTVSSLNFVAGQTVPNLVITKLGAGGKVTMRNDAGSTDVIADVLGYFSAGSSGRLTPLAPNRILDTRTDGGARRPVGQTPMTLAIAGRGGVPPSGASAVVLNLTGTEGNSGTYVTAYPSGGALPITSNVNLTYPGQTRANLVICKLGPNGAIDLYNDKGQVHLIADVVGYFTG